MSEQEPKYWLHRISWEWQGSYPLLKLDYLSIGFGDFGTKDMLDRLNKDFEGTIEAKWGSYGVNRFCLKNFINGMKKDDYVVIPKQSKFSIYKIVGENVVTAEEILEKIKEEQNQDVYDGYGNTVTLNKDGYLVTGDRVVDLGFFWRVKPVKQGLSRYDFENICNSLRYRRTNLRLEGKTISEIKALIPEDVSKSEIISSDDNEIEEIAKRINQSSIANQVVDYLKAIKAEDIRSLDGEGKEFCEANDIDVYAGFEKIDSSIYVKIQKEDSNVKDWIREQVTEFRKGHSNGEDSSLLWLISYRGYFQEAIKKDAGIGLKLSTRKEIEELYLNYARDDNEKAYSDILNSLIEKVKNECNDKGEIQIGDTEYFDRSQLLFCKTKDGAKGIVILPIIFELQNVKYIKKHFKEYLQIKGGNVGIIVFGDTESGMSYIVYDVEKKSECITSKIEEVIEVINGEADIETLRREQNKKYILDNLSFMNDDNILEKCEYDESTKKWRFKNDEYEDLFWGKLLGTKRILNGGTSVNRCCGDIVCRYTSLQSLFLMLDNKTYRMQGLVGMNDISEVDYVDEYCGLKSNQNDANNIFISSCSPSTLEDNLTMWRLYGDEARGVCLVFKVSKDISDGFTFREVEYIDNVGSDFRLEIVKRLISYGFLFYKINKWKHFFKAAEYKIEDEIRLLFERTSKDLKWNKTDKNGIINPSVDFELDETFPLQLTKIILGPKCPEKYVNIEQVRALIKDKNLVNSSDIVVTTSSIDNYR